MDRTTTSNVIQMDGFVKRNRDPQAKEIRGKRTKLRVRESSTDLTDQEEAKAVPNVEKFTSASHTFSEKLAQRTHGLVTSDEFRKHREELEVQERDAHIIAAAKAEKDRTERKKAREIARKKSAASLSFNIDDEVCA